CRGRAFGGRLWAAAARVLAAVAILALVAGLGWPGAGTAYGAERVRLALLDDPSRDIYLYALHEGIVASDDVQVEVVLLPMPAIIDAAGTRQFDLVETAGVALPLAARGGFRLLAASPALMNEDGT